jgi:hypothetical protein
MVIKFYQNSIFTVDDGPPRSAEDPANQAFLQAIKERRVPDELAAEFMDGLDLSLMPMPEDYDPTKAPRYALHWQNIFSCVQFLSCAYCPRLPSQCGAAEVCVCVYFVCVCDQVSCQD